MPLDEEQVPAVYNPHTGRVGCVLLQAAQCCEPDVAKMFPNEHWDLAPVEGQAVMRATPAQWRWLASLTLEERVERWKKHT